MASWLICPLCRDARHEESGAAPASALLASSQQWQSENRQQATELRELPIQSLCHPLKQFLTKQQTVCAVLSGKKYKAKGINDQLGCLISDLKAGPAVPDGKAKCTGTHLKKMLFFLAELLLKINLCLKKRSFPLHSPKHGKEEVLVRGIHSLPLLLRAGVSD